MKWCRFQSGATAAYGIIEGDAVTAVTGTPFEGYTRASTTVGRDQVKLLVPVIPPTFYAAGVNYREHVTEMAQRRGAKPEFPPKADVGYRANNALVADGETIVIPKDATEQVQYEGELVVVIGKRCKHVSEAEALDCVFGYTIGNDVSERTWQRGDRTFWRGKNTDTFKPMGPWIVTDLDPDELRVTIRLNGKEMFTYAVNDAIFGIRSVHQPDEPVPDALPRRRDLDGHRRRHGEHEAWRRGGGGDPRHRGAAQPGRARAVDTASARPGPVAGPGTAAYTAAPVALRIGVDIGGTFTDLVALDEATGEVGQHQGAQHSAASSSRASCAASTRPACG